MLHYILVYSNVQFTTVVRICVDYLISIVMTCSLLVTIIYLFLIYINCTHGFLIADAIQHTIIHEVSDSVSSGNYTYYSIKAELLYSTVVLITHQGDADVYIAQSTFEEKPTYSSHEYQSVTLGIDYITLPPNIIFPVIIAVYGHQEYTLSNYTLYLIQLDDTCNFDDTQFLTELSQNSNSYRSILSKIVTEIIFPLLGFVLEIVL